MQSSPGAATQSAAPMSRDVVDAPMHSAPGAYGVAASVPQSAAIDVQVKLTTCHAF